MQTSSPDSSISNMTSITSPSSSSSSSSSSPYPPTTQHPPLTRCIGLNLLVKAIHQVTNGSIIGVPYIQRRIITRRKRPIQFNNLIIATNDLLKTKKPKKAKRQRRVGPTMPAKFKDFSVFQPLTPKRRSSLSSSSSVEVDIIGE
ncbi:hypothetical protein Tco_1160265 [Tanacetum coccineum]